MSAVTARSADVRKQIEDALGGATERQLIAEVLKRQEDGRISHLDKWRKVLGIDEDGPEIEDAYRLEEVVHRLKRREYGEALFYLAGALGPDFAALADIRAEHLR